jgi:hypothetical protein
MWEKPHLFACKNAAMTPDLNLTGVSLEEARHGVHRIFNWFGRVLL